MTLITPGLCHDRGAPCLTGAWHRYLTFAVYVVGISGGVRIWSLEQYILPRGHDQPALVLTGDRWTFEVFRELRRLSEPRAGRGQSGPEEAGVR